ncbi:hypothetical protein ON010_g18284 [Phytophthora cinnamomi]|nr:hypothetical protein ON010_g18284 [Phytophthora cinnamomi]
MRCPSLVDPASQSSQYLEDLLASAPPGELTSSMRRAGQPELAHEPKPAMLKKKRVRREVRELKYLREQTHILELRLAQLKKRAPARSGLSPALPTSHGASAQSIWEGIVERQLEERLSVEKAQRELSATYSVTAKLVLDLAKELKSCAKDMRLSALVRQKPAQLWDFRSADSAGVFADQLTQISKAYFKMQQQCLVPVATLQLITDPAQGLEIVRTDPNVGTGVVFEKLCCNSCYCILGYVLG